MIALNRLNLAANPERNRAIGEHLLRVHDELRSEVDEFLTTQAIPPASGRPVPSLG